MAFNDKAMPEPNSIKNSKIDKKRPSVLFQKLKKKSIVQIDGLEELKELENETLKLIKEQEELSLVEQVQKRQKEEKEKKENKKREILKKLEKPKKIDIDQFLTRIVKYEQKKNFNLEQKRYKQLEKESHLFADKPILTPRTYEICKLLNKKPITERTKDMEERSEKRVNSMKNTNDSKLRSKKNNKRLNNSMENSNIVYENKLKKEEYIINDKIKNKKMKKNEMNDYYKRQYEWKNKLEQKNRMRDKRQKKLRLIEIDNSFQLSPGTLEIIKEKNRIKNRHIFTNNLNTERNVYERLYGETALLKMKKNENENKALPSFHPYTNKNKYKQIQSKYKENNTKKKGERTKIKKNKLKVAKSVEVDRRGYEEVVLNEKTNNDFLKSKHNLNDEEVNSYRLNIRQASAWNENDVNIVLCKGGSEEIVNFFI